MEQHVVNDLAICVVTAWLLAIFAKTLKQPLIIAYLLGGFLIGPVGFHLVHDHSSVESIAAVGLLLLLFMIGLEIDLKKILGAGKLIFVTGALQMLGGCAVGVLFFRLLGYPLGGGAMDALYISVALASSSTVIIVKLLYEKRELDTLPGRITLGVMVLQDLFTIIFLAIQPNLANPGITPIALSLGKIGILLAAAFSISRYLLPTLFRSISRLPEVVLLGALAWCFFIAWLAGQMDLSREMGALIAGVALSTFPYTLDIAAKVTSLRDFFITLFFVVLGMNIPAPTPEYIYGALIASVFLVASRLLTVFPALYLLGQGFRAALLPAISLSQVSELSLVVLAIGLKMGHIQPATLGVVSYTFVILGILSAYGIMRNDAIYRWAQPRLTRLGLRDLGDETAFNERPPIDPTIFILGFSWSASSLLEELSRHQPQLLRETVVLDFNPNVNAELRRRGQVVIYGDISQRDTLLHAGIDRAKTIVCSVPNTTLKGATNLKLLQQLRELNSTAQIIVHAEHLADVPVLYAAGANYVSVPRLLEGSNLCEVVRAAQDKLLEQKRAEQEHQLANRAEVIP